jgi:hypothetical protein
LCPLQGLFNVIIYLRPSFLLWRDAHPNKGRIWAIRQILNGKKVTVTRRRSHLVDGNVNEDTKCHDDTTTPTLRTCDNDSRSQGVRCSGNSSSRRTDGSLAMLDRWKLEDDDEEDPQNRDTTEENHDTTEENRDDDDDLEPPRRPPPAPLLETAAKAIPPDDFDGNDTNNADVVVNVIGRQPQQQQRQEVGLSLQSAEMSSSSPLSPRRDSHGLRVSFADDAKQPSQNDGLRVSFTDGPLPLDDDDAVRPQNGLRVSFSDEQPSQMEETKQQRIHAPEDIAPRRQQQQQQQEQESPQENKNDADGELRAATSASVVGASANVGVSDREDRCSIPGQFVLHENDDDDNPSASNGDGGNASIEPPPAAHPCKKRVIAAKCRRVITAKVRPATLAQALLRSVSRLLSQ